MIILLLIWLLCRDWQKLLMLISKGGQAWNKETCGHCYQHYNMYTSTFYLCMDCHKILCFLSFSGLYLGSIGRFFLCMERIWYSNAHIYCACRFWGPIVVGGPLHWRRSLQQLLWRKPTGKPPSVFIQTNCSNEVRTCNRSTYAKRSSIFWRYVIQ